MKSIIIISALIIALSFSSFSFAQEVGGELSWDLGYLMTKIYTQPYRQGDLAPTLPFIAAQLSAGVGLEEDDWFGILFGAEDRDTFWVYELYDIDNGGIIKRITLSEMMGITTDNGCTLIRDSLTDDNKIQTEYEIKTGVYNLKFKRFISKIRDRNIPGEHKLRLIFEVENLTRTPVNIRFSVRHRNDDYAITDPQNDNVLYTINKTPNETGDGYNDLPMLVQVYSPAPEFALDKPMQQEKGTFTISTATFPAKPVQRVLSKGRVRFGEITFAVTTIQDVNYVTEQAVNLANYLMTSQPEPRLNVKVEPDKWKALPGEEITYDMLCMHVGTGISQGGTVTDPIPQGVQYVPNSATGQGTAITYSVDSGSTFVEEIMPGEIVTHIRWKITENLNPGESIKMSFKVRLEE